MRVGRKCRVTANMYEISFRGKKNVIKLIVGKAVLLYEYTKNHWFGYGLNG